MKLLFKQRLFSWFDSYDIYDENENTIFVVKGELAWGHRLRVFDANGNELGVLSQKVLSWMPKFEVYINGGFVGLVRREFTLFRPTYRMEYKGWQVEGDVFEWDYDILSQDGAKVAHISKKLFNWADTYLLDIVNPEDALSVLMLVIAIDAEKCSRD